MISKFIQVLTYWPIYLILRFFADFKVEGQKNLQGLKNQGIIFASNHTSYFDGPISAAAMPRRGCFYPRDFFPIRFTVASEFFSWKNSFPFPFSLFATFYVRINNSIPIERTKGKLYKSLKAVIKNLKNGAKVWIYPEGKIGRSAKKLQSGRRGVAYLNKKTKLPIVPVAIIGTYNLSALKFFTRKTRIEVRIGRPIYSLGDTPLEKGTKIVMRRIRQLLRN